jgi:UDP-N-acetylglucosamine:LPS N-acetylglucosamine transferase
MSRAIMIMAGGTGGHIFGSGVTRTARALAFTEDAALCTLPEPAQ